MPTRVIGMSLGLQQATLGDLTTTGNLILASGKTLTSPSVTATSELRNGAGALRADTATAVN